MSKNPSLAVIMSVFNGAEYLQPAITSILTQTYNRFVFYITDDGSTDETGETLAAISDKRIVIIKNESNLVLIVSLNNMLEQAVEEIIVRMDADDISEPQRLQRITEAFRDDQVAWVNSKVKLMNIKGELIADTLESRIREDEYLSYLPYSNFFGHGSAAYRRKTVLELGGYNSNALHVEDYDLWLRMSANRLKFQFIPEYLYQLREHARSISSQNRKKQQWMRLEVSKPYWPEGKLLTTFYRFLFKYKTGFSTWILLQFEHVFKRYLVLKSIITNKF